jgi:ABC-type glutathione transport system ATPase component
MSSGALLVVEGLAPSPRAVASPAPQSPRLVNLSFQVAPAEQVAVLGARGAGKSTLLRAIAVLQPPAAGRVLFDGLDLTRLRPGQLRAVRRRLPFVGGDPARQFAPRATVAEALAEPLHIHRLGTPAERPARAAEALAQFGLNPGLLGRPVHELSAGLRQVIVLARALILRPQLLLADEIIDHLEPAAAAPLLERLAALCRARALAWVWTTSDPALARRFADRVLLLEAGRLSPA